MAYLRQARGSLLLLTVPLLVYLGLYIGPLIGVLMQSVDNTQLAKRFDALSEHIERSPTIDDGTAAAILSDLARMTKQERAETGRVLNQEKNGLRRLLMETGADAATIVPTLAGLESFNSAWADMENWHVLQRVASPLTWRNLERAAGLTRGSDGSWSRNDGDDLYVRILGRTLFIAAQVALLTTLIGYPIAYLIANSSPTVRWLVLSAVVLSFWTSILVRTTAWVVLLQTRGLVNELLLWLNFIDEPLQLIFNRLGAVLAMTHVMLPFAILPIYNVMRTIPPDQRLASRSLGAGPIETFLRAYLPQTKRGILIGAGTVYILALGFYITPALTGGPSDQMLSYYISDFVQRGLNWGMASTLSILLLICLLVMLGIGVLLLRVLGPGAESPR